MGRNGTSEFTVLVVDDARQFVEYVSSAVARRALKDGVVTVFRKQPFSVQLPPGITHCPKTFAKARRTRKETGNKVISTDFNRIFENETNVWVKSLVPGQVSLEFRDQSGNTTGLLVPYSGDPINLTDHVGIDTIRTSTDLRKLCKPRQQPGGGHKPPALKLMTDEEATEHFRAKAARRKIYKKDAAGATLMNPDGTPVLDVNAAAQPKITHSAVPDNVLRVKETRSATAEALNQGDEISSVKNQPLMMAEVVTPRVLQICLDVSAPNDDDKRPLAADMLDELEPMQLTADDLNHIMAHGYYKSVKRWAQEQLSSAVVGEDDE